MTEFTEITSSMPGKDGGLNISQLRVLYALYQDSNGAFDRSKLAERCGNKTAAMVGKVLGCSNPMKRYFSERSNIGKKTGKLCYSLLTLKMVEEIHLDIDGATEKLFSITEKGIELCKKLSKETLKLLQKPIRGGRTKQK